MDWKRFLIYWFAKNRLRHSCIGLLAMLTVIFSFLWLLSPEDNYEPVIVFLGALLTALIGIPNFIVHLQEAKLTSSIKGSLEFPENVTGQDVGNALQKSGFELKRQRGSHGSFSRNGCLVTVPLTQTALSPSMINAIYKQSLLAGDLTKSEFISKLKNA